MEIANRKLKITRFKGLEFQTDKRVWTFAAPHTPREFSYPVHDRQCRHYENIHSSPTLAQRIIATLLILVLIGILGDLHHIPATSQCINFVSTSTNPGLRGPRALIVVQAEQAAYSVFEVSPRWLLSTNSVRPIS